MLGCLKCKYENCIFNSRRLSTGHYFLSIRGNHLWPWPKLNDLSPCLYVLSHIEPTLTLTINRSLLHSNQWLDYYIAICRYHRGYWPWPHPSTDQYFIPYRCVLSITTDIGLPAKFDTLAIVSIFLPGSYS